VIHGMNTSSTPAASQSAFAAALLDPALAAPAGLRTWNGSDPAARLAVHRNNVISSLVDALADTVPVVQALVGAEFFRAMAAVFVRQCPPRTRVLAHYGDELPAFLAGFAPAQGLPYLADVARLELARVRAFHAADADPLAPAAVAQALSAGEHIGDLRLHCHPSLQWLDSPFAIVSLWAAHQGDEGALAAVDPSEPECALVLRDGLDVLVLTLPAGAAAFIGALLQGYGLGDAAAAAAHAAPDFDLAATLSLLVAHGAITDLQLPCGDS
jgi:Putative DNA-binding domain